MWRLLWCLVAVLPWTIVGATGAGAETFYVSPGGDDTGRCELGHPCATFQRAFDVCPTGGSCGVVPAPGVYRQLTNVYYYKAISIAGEKDAEGHCVDRSKVIVEPPRTTVSARCSGCRTTRS
jgi:hypothetical protein